MRRTEMRSLDLRAANLVVPGPFAIPLYRDRALAMFFLTSRTDLRAHLELVRFLA